MTRTTLGLAAMLAAVGFARPANAGFMAGYYVARDGRSEVGGNPDPNFGRLTLLFNHGDHFHSIGRFGAPEGRLPEGYIGGRIDLRPGTGAFAGRFVSAAYLDPDDPASEYSNLETRSIHTLEGFPAGSPEAVLLNSSGRRWSRLSLAGSVPTLELVEITPGLRAGAADGTGLISTPGQRLTLGAGESFTFTPLFVTDPGAAPGAEYFARFRLVDARGTGTPFGESGTFRFEFQTVAPQAVPAPGGLALLGLGVPGLVGLVRRHRRGPSAEPAG